MKSIIITGINRNDLTNVHFFKKSSVSKEVNSCLKVNVAKGFTENKYSYKWSNVIYMQKFMSTCQHVNLYSIVSTLNW